VVSRADNVPRSWPALAVQSARACVWDKAVTVPSPTVLGTGVARWIGRLAELFRVGPAAARLCSPEQEE
jgi:hypothetical protein